MNDVKHGDTERAPPPSRIGAHFEVVRELGRGGMATVYLCTDTRTRTRVAVKVLRPEVSSAVILSRFMREIDVVSRLQHPRIPQALDSGSHDGLTYYAMTYVEGESLRQRLFRDHRLAFDEAARIAREVLDAMQFAHQNGVIHRDLKPDNILIGRDGVYVLDFGVARAITDAGGQRLTATGFTVGTPAYMSPEQILGERDIDARTDIFALGCVLYEMLTGAPPFTGPTPQAIMARRFAGPPERLKNIRPDTPDWLDSAVVTALAVSPDNRWKSADAFLHALRESHSACEALAEPERERDDLLNKLRATFANAYRVESEITGGGMSRLFLATDLHLQRRVVIKILPPELTSPTMLARFRRESEVTARLQHPHILPVISAGMTDGLVHYIMPYIEGESLRGRLKREGQLPVGAAVRLLRELVDALAYAHRHGVIHRDIKPENVLIQDGHAILADFGIAAALSATGDDAAPRLTGTGMSLGTVGYMAPEQALGERTIDGRADIYAIGVVGYEMFAGTPPFTGTTAQSILAAHLTKSPEPLTAVRPDTPEPIAAAIGRALEKEAAARFQTAEEFRDALDAPVPLRTPAPQPVRVVATSWRRVDRRIALPVAVIALVAAAYFAVKARSTAAPSEIVTIAIAPFNALSSDLAVWHEGLVDVLARNLDGAGPLRTVSPTLAIRGFTGPADRRSAAALALRTDARYAIFGNVVGSSQDSVRLRATLLDVSADKATDYERVHGTVEQAADSFTVWVLRELGRTHRIGAVRQASLGSTSLPALRAFLQGEQFYRRTSWDSAGMSYTRALSFDSTFALALRRAAQITTWQRNGSDSVARALLLRAGRRNRNLALRDSFLIAADSLSAALATMTVDSLDWGKAKRLFATLNAAVLRYPNDPEMWFALGEARYHHGFGSPVNVTDRETLDAFNRAIRFDSAFAPAYVHAIELAFAIDGAELGRRYTRAYLALNPTDDEAEGINIVGKVAGSGGTSGSVDAAQLDRTASEAIMAAWYTVRRWPDSAETALRLLQAIERRPRSSATYSADSARLWNYMPLQLAYRGRLSEAYLAMGKRPWRLFVELALLGGIPPDTARAEFRKWLQQNTRSSYYPLAWLAQDRDTAAIATLASRADAQTRSGTNVQRREARYLSTSTRAYLLLARGDTVRALEQFLTLQDTLCIACYMDRVVAGRLLMQQGRYAEARKLLQQRLNTLLTPTEIWISYDLARVAERLGDTTESRRSYKRVADAWGRGDPQLQRIVADARARSGPRQIALRP